MRHKLPTHLVLAAALVLGLSALGHSQDTADASDASAVQAPDWGVGFGYLPGTGGALNALSATYRFDPDLDLDGLLLGGGGSAYNGGTNSAGQPISDSYSDFGIGAQARYSLLHPVSFLAFQAVGRLSYVIASADVTHAGTTVSTSGGEFGIFLGAGFEGFIPAWQAVSVEVNSGFNIAVSSLSVGGNSTTQSGFFLGASNANTFVPFNLAVHYYF